MKNPTTFTSESTFHEPVRDYSGKQYILATLSILLLALLHAAIVYAVLANKPGKYRIDINDYLYPVYLIYGVVLVVLLFFYPLFVMVFVRPAKPVNYLMNCYRWHIFSKERVLFSFPVLVIMPINNSIYTFFKNRIPSLNPFWLDAPLHNFDKLLFFGHEPWRFFHFILGNQNMTRALDFLYTPVWISLLVIFFLYHAIGPHSLEIRVRFFISYIIIWAGLGNLLATVFSSAGPCYFTQVTGQPSPYAELMGYLYSINTNGLALYAVQAQEMLWNCYVNTVLKSGSGISAMPSIHIATAALFGLSMRHTYPVLEKLFYCYTFILWVSSVHLGWHYASDGLVSLLFVVVIWYYSGKLTDKIIARGK